MKRTFLSLLIVSLLTVSVGTTATRIVKPAKLFCYYTFTPDEELICIP